MRSYGQYCPVAKAAEALGDRWTLLIVRELVLGSHRFNDIERGLPRISRSILSQRLQQLVRQGILEKRSGQSGPPEYHLTAAGEEIGPLLLQLGEWGARWAFGEPSADELDPVLLLWWMRGRVHHDALPPRRIVVRFQFWGVHERYWLVLEPSDASLCLKDPGLDVDLVVSADLATLYEVWLGRVSFADAIADEAVCLSGNANLQRSFPQWFALSPMAETVRTATST